MAQYNPSGGQTYTLQSSISSTQTTITLTSFTVPVSGTLITMAVMNTTIAYMTIAPRTTQSEFISFTGVTQNADGTATLTGVTRGLDKNSPFTSVSGFKLAHPGSTQVILSDAPQVFNRYAALANDNTFTGQQIFPASGAASSPLVGLSYVAPLQDTEVATKKYVDSVAIAGAPDATTSVKGISQLPTQAQQEAGTATGSTGATLVLTNALYGARSYVGYAADAGSNDTYVITLAPVPSAYFAGMVLEFKAATANTGAATLNVNGLGAKNLFLGGIALITGIISANSFVLCQYDGTQFNILAVSDGTAAAATAGKIAQRNSTGDVTVNSTPTASTDAASKNYVDTRSTLLNLVTTDVTYSSSTAENALLSYSVPGGTLGSGNVIRVTMHVPTLQVTNTSTFTLRFKYGVTTLVTKIYTAAGNINLVGKLEFLLAGAGTTSSQNGSYALSLAQANYVGNANTTVQMIGESQQGTSAIDSTASGTLAITGQFSNSGATDAITVSMIVTELIK